MTLNLCLLLWLIVSCVVAPIIGKCMEYGMGDDK